jgi:hypothetical protein
VGRYIPPPLKKSHLEILEHQGVGAREVTYASLRREKLWILRTKKFSGLQCSLLLRMMAPLNLEESNRSMSRDSVLLIENLHWMLRIRQVGIGGHDVVDNDINERFQAFLQLGDVEHIIHTAKVGGSSKWYTTFPSLAETGNGLM